MFFQKELVTIKPSTDHPSGISSSNLFIKPLQDARRLEPQLSENLRVRQIKSLLVSILLTCLEMSVSSTPLFRHRFRHITKTRGTL